MDVTIVIPTKNAGKSFKDVLWAILNQKTELNFEIICVDSGSKDGTVEFIQQCDRVKLFQISPSEFGHGKTRNYGASKGTGEFIVFITQDALPASNKWLDNLVKAVKRDRLCVGAFGIHYPYPDCNIFDKRDLEAHFKGFGNNDTYYWITDVKRYREDEGYRHMLCFYSDNNSCMRRSIWEKYPYDDVNFAEDQLWAKKMIELGYHKAYTPHAPVFHSHNYKVKSFFYRYYDEYKGLYELHQYVMHKSWPCAIGSMLNHIRMDHKYIKTCGLSLKERNYWRLYSIGKNWGRYVGGWFGGHYHLYGKSKQRWMDNHFSQQIKQINR